jgi:hypothetical protein
MTEERLDPIESLFVIRTPPFAKIVGFDLKAVATLLKKNLVG